jgi:hypothetical protein
VWHSGWAYGGYWASRPWGYGWYGTAPLAWGVAGMATAAAISSSVNAAAVQESTVIVVPQTGFQLNYASVKAIDPDSVSFTWTNGALSQAASGNCRQSEKRKMCPPGLVTRSACAVQIATHVRKLRWSRLSPPNDPYSFFGLVLPDLSNEKPRYL